MRREGLLRHTVFRPSGETRLQQGLAAMPRPTGSWCGGSRRRDHARGSGDGGPAPGPPRRRARARRGVGTHELRAGDLERDVAAPRAWSLLAARSAIEEEAIARPCPCRPPARTRATAPRVSPPASVCATAMSSRPCACGPPITTAWTPPAASPGAPHRGARPRVAPLRARQFGGARPLHRRPHQLDDAAGRADPARLLAARFRPRADAGRAWRHERLLVGVAEGGAGLSYGLGQRGVWSAMADIGLAAARTATAPAASMSAPPSPCSGRSPTAPPSPPAAATGSASASVSATPTSCASARATASPPISRFGSSWRSRTRAAACSRSCSPPSTGTSDGQGPAARRPRPGPRPRRLQPGSSSSR